LRQIYRIDFFRTVTLGVARDAFAFLDELHDVAGHSASATPFNFASAQSGQSQRDAEEDKKRERDEKSRAQSRPNVSSQQKQRTSERAERVHNLPRFLNVEKLD